MGLTDGYLMTLDKQVVFPDIVNLGNINNIGAVDLYKGLPVYLLFQVLDGIMGNVLFIAGHKLYIVAHALDEKNFIVVEAHQLPITLNKYMICGSTADIIIAPGGG